MGAGIALKYWSKKLRFNSNKWEKKDVEFSDWIYKLQIIVLLLNFTSMVNNEYSYNNHFQTFIANVENMVNGLRNKRIILSWKEV